MIRQLQRGDPEVAPSYLTPAPTSWPPPGMEHRITRTCDECGSGYYASSSPMASLCPDCSHHLYGYPNCAHVMVAGRCETCGWDGSVSPYVASLKVPKPGK